MPSSTAVSKGLSYIHTGSTHVLHVASLSDNADQNRHLDGYEIVVEKSIDELRRRLSDAQTVNRQQRRCRTQHVNNRSRLSCTSHKFQLNKV